MLLAGVVRCPAGAGMCMACARTKVWNSSRNKRLLRSSELMNSYCLLCPITMDSTRRASCSTQQRRLNDEHQGNIGHSPSQRIRDSYFFAVFILSFQQLRDIFDIGERHGRVPLVALLGATGSHEAHADILHMETSPHPALHRNLLPSMTRYETARYRRQCAVHCRIVATVVSVHAELEGTNGLLLRKSSTWCYDSCECLLQRAQVDPDSGMNAGSPMMTRTFYIRGEQLSDEHADGHSACVWCDIC
jgi:hypothetical protein